MLKQSDVTWLKLNFKWNNVDIDYGEINKIWRFDFRLDPIFDIAPAALKNIAHLKSGSQSNLKVIILLCTPIVRQITDTFTNFISESNKLEIVWLQTSSGWTYLQVQS